MLFNKYTDMIKAQSMLKYMLDFLSPLKIYLYKGNEMYNDKIVGSPRKTLAISKPQGISNYPLGF